jgi:hypothetical protein
MPSSKIESEFQGNEEEEEEQSAAAKKNNEDLARLVTLPFADDIKLYQPRIDKQSRLNYWASIIVQSNARRVQPMGFKKWVRSLSLAVPAVSYQCNNECIVGSS